MKRITFLALAMCLTFGLMAQEFVKTVGKQGQFIPANKSFTLKTTSSTLAVVTGQEVMSSNDATGEEIGFPVSFNVTLNDDATYFYLMVTAEGALQNFIDTNSYGFSTMDQYLLYYANYMKSMYAAYGYNYDPFNSGSGSINYTGFYGNETAEVYVLSINSDTTETHVTSQVFSTPSSAKSGTATIQVSKTDDPSVGEISWTTTAGDNTREFYFFCETNDADGARFYIENYGMQEDSGYMYNAYQCGTGSYSQYFAFEWNADINNTWAGNPFAEDGTYVEGTEYCYGALPVNGNGEYGTFVYAIFTYGSTASLNDVVEFTNNLRVYPNPARETVSINSTVSMNKVELYNTLGQLVYSENVNSNSVSLPVSNLNNGTYIVKAYADGIVVNTKVVVE